MEFNVQPKLVLFDGNALLHRAYHAYPQTLKTQNGELTNATYGFTSTLLTTFRKLNPSHVIVAFDEKEPTFRKIKFAGYKAQRPKVDDELIGQIERTRQVVDTLNIPRFNLAGYEADDLIGTIKTQAENQVDEIYIITGDKDILQLLSAKTKVVFPARGKKPESLFDPELFTKEYGFKPKQLIDYKALAGDQSDAIPGVNGIGPKTATDLIIKYGCLENIYANLEQIPESVKAKLIKDKDNAFLSKDLATIHINVPINFELPKAKLSDYDKDKAIDLFTQLEFKSLIKRLPQDGWEEMAMASFADETKAKPREENQMTLF